MSGDHHNSNVELIAQGIANLISPMVGGIRPPVPSRAPQPIFDPAQRHPFQVSSTR